MAQRNIGSLFQKCLWVIVMIGLLASLPLAYTRFQAEQTAKTVDLVYDYRDLLTMANYHSDPDTFIDEQLAEMKRIGISSLAVFESTLYELELSNRIQTFTSFDAAVLEGRPLNQSEKYTYVLFSDGEDYTMDREMIEHGFSWAGIPVHPWSLDGDRQGLVIEAPPSLATMIPLEPDPEHIKRIQEYGFHVVARISDNRPYDEMKIAGLFDRLHEQNIRWIVFAGTEITGYEEHAELGSLHITAQLMNDYNIGSATIEMVSPQRGLGTVAYLTDYDTVRLHSITEPDSRRDSEVLADRMVLTVKDRNVRMLYLNGEAQRDTMRAELKNTLDNVYNALIDEEFGAIERLEQLGFEIGQAVPFEKTELAWDRVLMLLSLIGIIAFITLMIREYVPSITFVVFIVGLIGAAGLYVVVSSSMLVKMASLGVAISGPTLAIMITMRKIRDMKQSNRAVFSKSLLLFVQALMISFISVIFITGQLHGIQYMLVFDQFRGVDLLKVAPVVLVAIYYFFFFHAKHLQDAVGVTRNVLDSAIKVKYVVIVGIIGVIGMYYLSRAGNAGQVLPFERLMRTILEQTLGARPRTQEFLIGYPLFMLGSYAAIKYRKGLFSFIIAAIGLLTMVNTFTHLHTPLIISSLRTLYGSLLGIVLGAVLVLLLELSIKLRKRWKSASS